MARATTLRRRAGVLFACICTLVAITSRAGARTADPLPSRPITLIVPFSAGQTTDLLLRAMAPHAGKRLGQPIIIDNKPGPVRRSVRRR